MRQLFPSDVPNPDPGSAYDRLEMAPHPGTSPFVYINMVSSVDGRIQIDGRAAGIGSRTDKRLMLGLRGQADCIVHGSATIQAEETFSVLPDDLVALRVARGQHPQPYWAFATASGHVNTESRYFRQESARPIAFVAQNTPLDRREVLSKSTKVVIAGNDRPDPATMLVILRDRFGCARILVEGGPSLNAAMIRTDRVSDLFLTIAPLLIAGDGRTIMHGPSFPRIALPRMTLVSLFEHNSELFARYRFANAPRNEHAGVIESLPTRNPPV